MTSLSESRGGRPGSSATDKGRPGTSGDVRPGSSASNQPKKKSLMSSLFTKKEKDSRPQSQQEPQSGSPDLSVKALSSKPKKKNRQLNRKNIADGRALMEVKQADIVPPDYIVDYKDNPYEVFELTPFNTRSYIESLKNGRFYMVNNNALKGILEQQKENKKIQLKSSSDQMEEDMVDNIKSRQIILDKFFILIQGIYAGMSILQILLVYLGSSKLTTIVNYLVPSLRLSQTLLVLALLSAIGCLDKFFTSRRIYEQMLRNQYGNLQEVRSIQVRSAVATICFGVSYCLTIYNHEFNTVISNNSTDQNKLVSLLGGNDLTSFIIYQVITVIIAATSLIGWILVVSTHGRSEISDVHHHVPE